MAIFSHDPHEMDDDIMCYFGDRIADQVAVKLKVDENLRIYTEK
jgi:hypothetical protein